MPLPFVAKGIAALGGKKLLGKAGLRVGSQLLGSVLGGSGRSGQIARAQQAAFLEAQDFNRRVANLRLGRANELYDEASMFDPEYMGRQAAQAAMTRGAIQTAQQTRGLTGSRLAAERRRMQLGTARTAGTAFQQGFGTGVSARLQTRQAGLAAMPTSFPSATQEAMAAQYGVNVADQARANRAEGIGSLLGAVIGGGAEKTGMGASGSVGKAIGGAASRVAGLFG